LPESKWHKLYLAHKYNKDGSIKNMRDGTYEDTDMFYLMLNNGLHTRIEG
jgi:hypothetical protein